MVSSTGVCFLFLVYFLQFCRFFCVFFLSFYIILGRKGVETNHPSSTWTATRLGEQCEGSYFRRASYTRSKRHLAAGSETQNSPRWNWTVNHPWWVDTDWEIIRNCKWKGKLQFWQVFKGWQLPDRIVDMKGRGKWGLLIRTWRPCRANFSPLVVFHVRFRRPLSSSKIWLVSQICSSVRDTFYAKGTFRWM